MLEFLDYSFYELIEVYCKLHHKTQNDEHIYMEFKNIKHGEIEQVEVYYACIQKLARGLQTSMTNNSLTIVFWAGLQSYLRLTTIRMKWKTLQLHKEVAMLCEKGMTFIEAQNALSVPQINKIIATSERLANTTQIVVEIIIM